MLPVVGAAVGAVVAVLENAFFKFGVIVALSFVLASTVKYILKTYMARLAQKTKSDIDDVILGIVTGPLYLFVLFAGIYLAARSLPLTLGIAAAINGVFFVIAVLVIAMMVGRVLTFLTGRWLKVHKKYQQAPNLISKVVVVTVYLLAAMMILSHFDVQITPLLTALGIGGLAIGLALQNTLSNFFAGLHIISDQPIRVGDFVEVEGLSGYVEDIGWRSTRIRTLPNNRIIIPNGKLSESVIVNNSLPQLEMSVVVKCGVSYESDLDKVEKVTIDVARKVQKTVPGAIKDFEPFIRYNNFGDSNIDFSIILRVEEPVARYLVTHEFMKALKKRYDKEKIEISWPVRKIVKAK